VSHVLAFHDLGRPRIALGACPQGAIMCRPCGIAIGTIVAGALVWALKKKSVCEKWKRARKSIENPWQPESARLTVEATRSIFRATIWAVRPDCRKDGGENNKNVHVCFDSFMKKN
jgi:hypothetical protein